MEYAEYVINGYKKITHDYLMAHGLRRYSIRLDNISRHIACIVSARQIVIPQRDAPLAVLLDLQHETSSFIFTVPNMNQYIPITISFFKYIKDPKKVCSSFFARYVDCAVLRPRYIVSYYLFRDYDLTHQFRLRRKDVPKSSPEAIPVDYFLIPTGCSVPPYTKTGEVLPLPEKFQYRGPDMFPFIEVPYFGFSPCHNTFLSFPVWDYTADPPEVHIYFLQPGIRYGVVRLQHFTRKHAGQLSLYVDHNATTLVTFGARRSEIFVGTGDRIC